MGVHPWMDWSKILVRRTTRSGIAGKLVRAAAPPSQLQLGSYGLRQYLLASARIKQPLVVRRVCAGDEHVRDRIRALFCLPWRGPPW